MITVVFFASIREAIGTHAVEIEPEGIASVADVVARLRDRGGAWHKTLGAENILMAVNQTMVEPTGAVVDGDEVALFPPVTGG